MKIVYIGNFDSPHTYKLADYFIEKFNHEIYAFSEYEPTKKNPKIKYYYIFPSKSKFSILQHFKELLLRILKKVTLKYYYIYRINLFKSSGLFKKLNELEPDVVHAHFCSDYGRIAYYSGFKPYIVSCWGSDILIHPGESKYLKNEIKKVLQNATFIHTCANHLTEIIINEFNVSESKILEISYGLKRNIISYLGNKESNINVSNVVKIICSRAAKPVYDNESIILAAKILQSKGIDVELRMFTEGPLFKKYEKMIMELELNNFHLFPRLLNQKDLFKEYKKSDIYLSASISDGLSISLLEAFASKLYPIVSDIVANRNVIVHKNNGLLFKTNCPDSIVEQVIFIMNNQKNYLEAIDRNYQWVSHNQCFELNLNEINKLYNKCIKTSRENI